MGLRCQPSDADLCSLKACALMGFEHKQRKRCCDTSVSVPFTWFLSVAPPQCITLERPVQCHALRAREYCDAIIVMLSFLQPSTLCDLIGARSSIGRATDS